MPIVLQDPSGLAQGISQVGGALASALERRAQNRLIKQQRSALDTALEGADLQTQVGQQEFLRKTTEAGIPTQDALGILDRAIKQQSASQRMFQVDDPKALAGLFNRLGVPEDVAQDYADLYGNLSQGGRTSFANMFIDRLQRGEFGRPAQVSLEDLAPREFQPGGPADVEAAEEKFVFPEVDLFEGLIPKEKVQREKELFNANAKDFNELSGKIKSLKDDAVRVNTLERYNESNRLPEGMGKLNINWKTGDIRFPALANAETQGFVKTVNDFTVKAKETFGARVTNFELGAFMRRLPTLANSTEGRRQIIAQMQAMGDLDRLYYDSLKEVYDNYGLRGIDKQKAEQIAAELRAPKEEALKQKVANATQAQQVYEARSMAPEGKVPARDPKGNIVYIWSNQQDKAVERGYEIL